MAVVKMRMGDFGDPEMRPILQGMKSHQRVNHIPGSGYYTSKVSL